MYGIVCETGSTGEVLPPRDLNRELRVKSCKISRLTSQDRVRENGQTAVKIHSKWIGEITRDQETIPRD